MAVEDDLLARLRKIEARGRRASARRRVRRWSA